MKRSKVIFEFLKYSVLRKIEYGRNVVSKMTGNAIFPTPDLPLTTATTLCNNLELALIAADGGSKAKTSALRVAVKAWDDGFRKLAIYVERIANGAEDQILSSGFDASRQPLLPLRPEFHVENGEREGEVILVHRSLLKRAAWVWQYCADPVSADAAGWIWAGVTLQAKFRISGLESGRKYWFRASMVSIDGMGAWSDPHPLRVL